MKDIIEKSINLGLGIAATTKEKVESLVDELIAKGQLEKQEKSKAVTEILDKLEKSETEFKKKTSAVVKEAVNKLDYTTQKDIKELRRIVSNLEKKNNSK
jgi:polyhydroxyalkanoate synthesis regulator phasin